MRYLVLVEFKGGNHLGAEPYRESIGERLWRGVVLPLSVLIWVVTGLIWFALAPNPFAPDFEQIGIVLERLF